MCNSFARVPKSWRAGAAVVAYAYAPDRLFARFRYQVDATYANRLRLPAKGKLTKINLKRGLCLPGILSGELGFYRTTERRSGSAAWHALRRGQIEAIFGMGFVAWHLIQFTQEALGGRQNASFYAAKQYSAEGTSP